MSAPIPPDLQGLYAELKHYLFECGCDEISPNWPARSAKSLIERVARLEAENSSLRWRSITENNLPKNGDEILCIDQDTKEVFDLVIASPRMVKEWTAGDYVADWLTHFRPLNRPKETL